MPKIVVEGPDGKKYAFPDTMPREQINTFMKERYGTKARNETVNDYLARVVREQDATKARAKSVTKEATAAGRAEGERAAERMGVDNAFEMAMAAPAIGMAQQAGARPVFDREGTMLADEAAGLAALNTAGFFIPGMVNERFGQRVEEGRRQQPAAAFAGDVAGGMIGGELIGLGLQKAGQAIAPGVSAIGRLFKGKPAAAPAASPEPPMVLGPQNRILPVDRPDALPGDDVEMARALDAWTPPVEQQVRPMGWFGGKKTSPDVVPSVTISPEERAMLTGQPVAGKARTVGAKEIPAAKADPEYDAARKLARLTPEEIATLLSKTDDDVTPSGFGGRVAKREKKAEPFYDDRLTPSENKAVEMRRNGYSANEIADEMETSEASVYQFFRTAKQKGVELKSLQKDTQTADILALTEKGLPPRVISERLGIPRIQVNVVLAKARKALGEELPDWLKPQKGGRPMGILTDAGKDAVEQTFGAAYMSGTGSVAGGQYDLNGDGQIDDTDLAIGSGIGLAAFASPLALRKVAELGGRLKGTKAPAGGDDINAAGFGSPAPRRTEAFMDDRLTPSENKALEMRRNGFSTEEIAEEMDTSTNTVLKFISTAKSKGVEVEPIKRGPPMNRTPDVLRLAEQGLRPNIIAERLGLTRNNVSVLLTKERTRLKKAGKPIPKWMSPRDPGGNIKEVN